jgi:O-antigen/teichoic acid export membrane protein
MVKMAAFIIFPAMLGLIVVSEPFIRLVLTEKWLPTVPFLRVVCVSGLTIPLQSLALSVIMAKGHSGLFLKLDIVKKFLLVITIFITYRWGVMAIVYGSAVLAYIFYYINFYYTGKKLNFSFGRQLLDLLPYFVAGLVMAAMMFISGYFISNSDALTLVVQLLTGIIVYALLSKLFKFEAYHETILVLVRVKSKLLKSK